MRVQGPLGRALARLARHRLAGVGAALLLLLVALVLARPLIAALLGTDAEAVDLLARGAPPSPAHPLGTDDLGRDLLLRLLAGGQVSLLVGLAGALGAGLIGALIGLVAGWREGWLDAALMRFTDGLLALPLLPLLIVLAAIDPGRVLPESWGMGPLVEVGRIVVLVALAGWPTTARLVRAATLSLKRREFVRAAEALGVPGPRIVLRHILPNAAAPLVVATTLTVGNVILLESALSFLGLGIRPPLATWGNMLSGGLETVWTAPLMVIAPGCLIFLTVMAVNFLGDGLHEALDPRGD
ncbi:ABC transporter permease [Roseospirillum parvum]|uniref:Peptide/nickel transport system permease protein n=1 Tax=Roseospirillum parvum TaxID=83401 RepID=A0A1G7V7V2_9PROT|nr:ABC transporter permease [Roseospirillum parvum]SDG55965.1 peptide/nickel transport system permease protein [Roseospirillum parvum]